jgi:outer membrane protein insertion porin family
MRSLSKCSIIFGLIYMFSIAFLFQPAYAQQILEVDEVEFRGNKTFDSGDLEDAVGISKSKTYKQQVVIDDIFKLKKFYFDNGFFETEVDTLIDLNYDDEEASVTYIIKENKRYRIDSITITGIEDITDEARKKINSVKTVKKNDFYSKSLIIQYQNEVLDSLQNSGYMNARLKIDSGTVIKRFKNEGTVEVSITVLGADTVFYFGSTDINIKNNVYGLRTEYPREEITYKEGEIFSKNKKLETERKMAMIPIISSAKLNPVSTSGDRVNFSADITLNKKNEITPFIKGSNFENRFYIGAGVRYLNRYFLSGNVSLLLELEEDYNSPGINRTELSATITKPHFIAKKITLINRLAIGFNNVENYKNYFIANLSTLNYFIAPHTFYNNAFLDLTEELIWVKYDTIATGRQTQFNSFLSITFEHNSTDNVLNPTSGFYHSILAGNAGLLPKLVTGLISKSVFYSQFFKAYTLNKVYFPLGKRDETVLASNIKIGDIIEYGSGENIIPVQPYYRFFSGGSSSVRGWNAKENGMLANKINGGKFLFEGSVELRKKLFPSAEGFTKNLSAAFFVDYGNVWESHKEFQFSQIAYAVGFGVRYDLFVGPIRFDFGFRLYDPQAPDGEKWLFSNPGRIFKDKFTVHFGIGQAF